MSRKLFLDLVEGIKSYTPDPFPKHFKFFTVRDATCLLSFSTIIKCTSAIRQLTNGISPDAFDEYLQMGHTASGCLDNFNKWYEMDDPNITMEEYIRLEEEKAHRRAIFYNDELTSEVALSCEPMISPLNKNQIDFRISFDKSDDEDYVVIYDKNSFSYKIIFVDDLKTDSENDYDKVNVPSFSSSEPTVSYFDEFDYFKDFEKEFPAVAYNDALTSKLDFSPEPNVSP
ncbi:hypothetical protein Tco_0800847 [Tanacetum coccineum]|uniref:Uncharacterized protein n=1 Tax=Tanacetum coccineum TaxID=301880 RepID=A0ABQ4ZUC2_9ASTR